VAADPALAAQVARLRAVRARYADLELPGPDAAALMARAKAGVAAKATRTPVWPTALAAGIAGLVVGAGAMTARLSADPVGPEMQARGVLKAALDQAASGGAVSRGRTRVSPLYTVAAADGRLCRAFRMTRGGRSFEGAACREGEAWRTVVVAAAPTSAGGFAQAGSPEPPAVTAAVDGLGPGAPLSAADEARLIARGWRRE
jgi:hypothetical protein